MSRFKLLAAISLILIIAFAFFSFQPFLASTSPPEPVISLRSYTFDPLDSEPVVSSALRAPEKGTEPVTSLIQFTGPVRPEWQAAVESAGVRLYGYIPDYAFIARLDSAATAKLQDMPFVRWVGGYHPAYALDPDLMRVRAEAYEPGGEVLSVQTLPDADLNALAQTVETWGGSVYGRASNSISGYLRIALTPDRLFDLARQDGVLWVERYHAPELLNDKGGGGIMRGTEIRHSLGLYGAGQIVAVADTGLDIGSTNGIHPDFQGKLVNAYCLGRTNPCDWSDPDGHGTHVAGSAIGSGVASGANPGAHQYDGSGAGLAPEARLVMQSVQDPEGRLGGIPDDNGDLMRQAYQDGARVHNNSWGGPTGGTQESPEYGGYDSSSQQVDAAAWERKDMLILFAAGNQGEDKDGDGLINPDSLGSPGTGKNVLTVGASENDRPNLNYAWGDWWPNDYPANPIYSDLVANNPKGLAAFSSRGPTDDGRIKPDVVAPGSRIISARSHHPSVQVDSSDLTNSEHYKFSDGTSMASPLTAGAAAIAREWLNRMKAVANPSAALIKAVLINGAADMSPGQYGNDVPASRPNIHTGWGRVDLVQSLNPGDGKQVWVQDENTGIQTGGTRTYQLTVSASQTSTEQTHRSPAEQTGSVQNVSVNPAGTNIIQNGGFESSGAWEMDGFERTNSLAHSGGWSAGSFTGMDGYFYQAVDVPGNATAATLSYYWLNLAGDPGFDQLQVFIYDEFFDIIDSGPAHSSENESWQAASVNLNNILDVIRGSTIYVSFEVVQDYIEPDATFYVDDVVLNVESGGGNPTATPTLPPGPTATPTQPSGATATPTRPPSGDGGPFRISLVWTDYPGEPGAGKTLVNDLNLEVIAPDGSRYTGNQGIYTGGQCLRDGKWDACNNVEGILIPSAQYGTYTVVVHGYNVPRGPQPFALAASGDGLRTGGGSNPTSTPIPGLDKPLFLPVILTG